MPSAPSVDVAFDLDRFWSVEEARVDARLDQLAPPADKEPARLHQAIRHAVLAPGKRLRPILAIAAFRACGGGDADPSILDPACALEMLHAYSLIHDDLPCMDDDDTRRGQPTVHVAFDEATAVLAGDALHAMAFEILGRSCPPGCRGELVASVARAIGTEGMIGGQMADLEAEGRELTEAEIASVHARKTAALIAASAELGGRIAGATGERLSILRAYSEPMGLAFQIVDDLLDIEGTSEATGKPVGSDDRNEKATYPGVVGVQAARIRASKLIGRAKDALTVLAADGVILAAIADRVLDRDH